MMPLNYVIYKVSRSLAALGGLSSQVSLQSVPPHYSTFITPPRHSTPLLRYYGATTARCHSRYFRHFLHP